MSYIQEQTTGGMEIEKFVLHRHKRKYPACLERPNREVKGEFKQREAGPGTHVFLTGLGQTALEFRGKTGLINSNQRAGFW